MSKRKTQKNGKNRRKKSAPRVCSTSAQPAISSRPSGETGSSDLPRAQRRLLGLLKGKRYDDALIVLEKTFSGDRRQERIELLLLHWPKRAVEEIEKCFDAGERESEDVWVALANRALVLTNETIDALEKVELFRLEELRAARRANELIAEGQDDEARRALRTISPRSYLREVRLFLTGLLEHYAGNHDRALAALSRLEESTAYGHAARSIGALSAITLGKLTPDTLCPSLIAAEKLASDRQRDILKVQEAQRLIARGKHLTLIGQMERWPVEKGSNLGNVLRRDVLFAIANTKKTLSRALYKFIERIADWDPFDFRGNLLRALLGDMLLPPFESVYGWLTYERELAKRTGTDIAPEQSRKARALVLHRAATRAAEAEKSSSLDDFDDDPLWDDFWGSEACDFEYDSAQSLFERSIEIDPGFSDVHKDLVDHLFEFVGQTKEKARALERFAKLFPDDGEAAFGAAQFALDRNAYDKGLKFAAKAAAARPMDKKVHELQFELFILKSIKKYEQGKSTEAQALWKRALADFELDPCFQSPMLTSIWISEREYAGGRKLEELEELWRPLPRSNWLIVFTVLRREKKGEPEMPFGLSVEALEDTPISAFELDFILPRCVEKRWLDKGLSKPIKKLAHLAIQKGIGELRDVKTCLDAADLAPNAELAYRALEIALKLKPGDPEMTFFKYKKALEAHVELSVLEGGLEEIETALENCRPGMATDPLTAFLMMNQLMELNDKVRAAINRSKRPKKRKKQVRKQNSKKQLKIPF